MKLNRLRKINDTSYKLTFLDVEAIFVTPLAYEVHINQTTEISFFYEEVVKLAEKSQKKSLFKAPVVRGEKTSSGLTTRVMIYAGVFGLSIAAGVPLGLVLHDLLATPAEANYGGLEISSNRASDELLEKYQSALDRGQDFSDGSFTLVEIMRLAATSYMDAEEAHFVCNGAATASIVNQTIHSCGYKKNGQLFSESLSYSSMVQTGLRTYQDGDSVTYYKAMSVDSSATFGSFSPVNSSTVTSDEYASIYGYDLTAFGNYYFGDYSLTAEDGSILNYCSIISSPTSSSDTDELSSIKKVEGGYEVYIRLDTLGGVANYATQMYNLSELDMKPVFNYCHLTYQLNEKLEPLSVHIDEQYNAKKGANAVTTTSMDITYSMGSSPDIPELTERISY